MLLNSVKLNNFRQYFGSVQLDFATSESKNVTIIRGENGVGKTALLNAVKWAFFESFTSNFRNPRNLVNDIARAEGKSKCSVEIEFTEDDSTYLLIRHYVQNLKKSELRLYKYEGDTVGPSLREPELLINTMLPKEMAEYFFFQGEGSTAVNVGNTTGDLAKSIRDILGFRIATELIIDLTKLSKSVRKKASELDTSGAAVTLNAELERVERDRSIQFEKKKNAESVTPKLSDTLEGIEEQLSLIHNKDLQTLRQTEKSLIAQVSKSIDKLAKLKKKKLEITAKLGWAVFGYDFANSSLDFIDESQLKGRLPEPYNETFIRDILEAGNCICGSELSINSDGYKKITEMLGKAANPELLQRLAGIRAQIQDIKTNYEYASDTISENLTSINETEIDLAEKQQSLKAIQTKLDDIPEEKIAELQSQKRALVADIGELNRTLGAADEKIQRYDEAIVSISKKLKESTPDSIAIENLKIQKRFIDEMIDKLEKHLEKTENNIRLHVLQEVNKTLNKFSRHDFKIKVNSKDFSFSLVDKDENIVGQGDGLNLLLNLTITSSLINFAASRKEVKDPILSSATVAPLLIDAPFGVLDNKYRNVVVDQLPKQTRQVIFLVSSSQWSDEMDAVIRDSIGAEYVLILEESAEQGERELDEINIQGKSKIVSRYNCDNDRTVIERIK